MTLYKLSPSDLTFLWDECPRCFYLKVARKFSRSGSPFPSIFNKIDGLMKNYFEGRSTADLHPDLPPGVVKFGEQRVQSQAIELPGHESSCYLVGKFDTVVQFEDGSYGVVDFKTSQPRPTHQAFYGRQLHAYSWALENPAPGKFSLQPISRLGLLVVEPVDLQQIDGRIAYLGDVTWQEIPRDDNTFLAFLGQVLALLDQPEPPAPGEKCEYCRYREEARQRGD